jgi:MYXO-CTERM domain-containing protein
MRTRLRLALLAVSVSSSIVGFALAGCGGDDVSSTPEDDASVSPDVTTGDGSTGSDTSTGDGSTAAAAVANDLTVYVGQTAQPDGSGSTPAGATLAWTVESVPLGSTVATATLKNASTAKPSFTADVPGDFTLKLTVVSGTDTNAKNVKVKAVLAPVLYGDLSVDAGHVFYEMRLTTTAGTDTHALHCTVGDDAGVNPTILSGHISAGGTDWWEAPAGQESRFVYVVNERQGDAALYTSYLAAAVTSSSCQGTPARKLVTSINLPATNAGGLFEAHMPRFSRDGNRVLYLDNRSIGATVATINFDGTNPHAHIAPALAYPDGGQQADASGGFGVGTRATSTTGDYYPPRWTPAGKVAWAELLTTARFQIMTADDADDATPSLYMACNASRLNTFDILADGNVLASTSISLDGGVAAVDLFVLRPNAVTKECEVVKNLTNMPSSASSASGMSLSPDGLRVAYIGNDTTVDAGGAPSKAALFVVNVDGLTPPAQVPGAPLGAPHDTTISGPRNGVRWVAGGSTLTWGQNAATIDAGDGGTAVAVIPAAGGNATAVAMAEKGHTILIASPGCSIASTGGSAVMAFGSLGAFFALALRRRRKKG